MTSVPGAVRLFHVFEIPVFLHWSWGVVALLLIGYRQTEYGSFVGPALEYVGLFAIVLLHELGHALACRSVGGEASHILLWPLGGVAHVRPPQRPGAVLWSIAAGPLVNLVLGVAAFVAYLALPQGTPPWLGQAIEVFWAVNAVLFVFNMIPVYPLDGGQILRALLWYGLGRERSLAVAAGLGLVGAVGGGIAAVLAQWYWIALLAAYAAWHSWRGLRGALAIGALARGPRHAHARCPSCGESPPEGIQWRCPNGHRFDAFATGGPCPECDAGVRAVACIFCGEVSTLDAFTRRR